MYHKGLLFAVGDVMAQQVFEPVLAKSDNSKNKKHDYYRTLTMATYGTIIAVLNNSYPRCIGRDS